jgi:hypothetical protein
MKAFKRVLLTVLVTVMVLNMTSCGMLLYSALQFFDDGAVMSCDEVVVDKAMMGFFLNDHIINWYNQYEYYAQLGFLGVDFSKDLKTQRFEESNLAKSMIDPDFEGSWYDYCMTNVKREVETYVVYASAAKQEGISLTTDQEIEIEIVISNLKMALQEKGAEFSDWYGIGVDEEAVRRCYELMFLAANFADHYYAILEEDIDEDEMLKYRERNKEAFYSADCLKYSLTLSSFQMTDSDFTHSCDMARAAFEAIASARSPEEFVQLVKEYEEYRRSGDDAPFEGGYGDEEVSEIDAPEEIEKLKENIRYTENGEIGEFLFGIGYEPASYGDTKVTVDFEKKTSSKGDEKTDYVKYMYNVYFVLEPMHYDTELTHDFAYFISDNEQSVLELKAELEMAEGYKDLGLFESIAKRVSGTTGNDNEIFETVEKAAGNYFYGDYKILNKWIEDDDRRYGDISDVIEFEIPSHDAKEEKVNTRYALLFLEGHRDAGWRVTARVGILAQWFSEWYDSELAENSIKESNAISKIETTKWFARSGGTMNGGIVNFPSGSIGGITSDSTVTVKPAPEGGMVVGPVQGGTVTDPETSVEDESGDESNTDSNTENKSENKFEVNTSIKVPVIGNIGVSNGVGDYVVVLKPGFDVDINVSSVNMREAIYVSNSGFRIFAPAIPNN